MVTVFKEMPYVSSINEECVRNRCSYCYQEANFVCPNCSITAYCNPRCMESDQVCHESECSSMETLSPYADLRLISRFAYRMQKDGGVAALSTGFPSKIPNRTCKDLLSHYREIKNDANKRERLETLWAAWQEFVTHPALCKLKKSDVLRMYSTLTINTFGIYVSSTIDKGHPWIAAGVGLYLNASRFNHSCSPDLGVQFNYVEMSVMGDKDVKEGKKSQKSFNRLTINYGVPASESFGAQIPLTVQRIASLKSRYYFKCRCPLCTDQSSIDLEERASVYECPGCKKPYVWQKRWKKLRPSCSCKQMARPKLSDVDRAGLNELDVSWKIAMPMAYEERHPSVIIGILSPLWRLAKRYWHPVANLRFGQLSENLFRAYLNQMGGNSDAPKEYCSDESALQDAMAVGEVIISCYDSRSDHDAQLAVIYCHLALLYEVGANDEKAKNLYTKAVETFKAAGMEANAEMVMKITNCGVKSAVREGEETTSMKFELML